MTPEEQHIEHTARFLALLAAVLRLRPHCATTQLTDDDMLDDADELYNEAKRRVEKQHGV